MAFFSWLKKTNQPFEIQDLVTLSAEDKLVALQAYLNINPALKAIHYWFPQTGDWLTNELAGRYPRLQILQATQRGFESLPEIIVAEHHPYRLRKRKSLQGSA